MSKLNDRLRMSGLSSKEIEIVNWLVNRTFFEQDINKQVIRCIYRKLGVQTYTQLITLLAPYTWDIKL